MRAPAGRRGWPRTELLPLIPNARAAPTAPTAPTLPTAHPFYGDKHPFRGNECALAEDNANQYVVDDLHEALYRVLFDNPPKTEADRVSRKDSILGYNGHVERSNAWSHIVAAALLAFFVCVRPAVDAFDNESVAGQLSALAATASAVTFATSAGFHVFSSVRWLSPGFRLADHSSILLALGLTALADVALTTRNFANVPMQTAADPLLLTMALFCAGFYRRFVLDPDQTEESFGSCKTGLFRFSHTDGDWHATRSTGYLVVPFSFLLTLPVGFANLGGELMAILVATNAVSVVVLISSMILDSMLLLPDFYYLRREVEQRDFGAIPCHSKRAGCVASSHFWWHVGAFVAVAIQVSGREAVLSRLKA